MIYASQNNTCHIEMRIVPLILNHDKIRDILAFKIHLRYTMQKTAIYLGKCLTIDSKLCAIRIPQGYNHELCHLQPVGNKHYNSFNWLFMACRVLRPGSIQQNQSLTNLKYTV